MGSKASLRIMVGLLAVITSVVAMGQASAQDDAVKKMVNECLEANRTKFKPLKAESDAIYSKYSYRSSAARDVIRWLEENPAIAERKRQEEIAKLTARLEALKSMESKTTGDGLNDVKATVETVHTMIDDADDDRRSELRPLERKRSALQREFKDRENELEPIMEGLFFEKGANELTSELTRSYASFSYATAEASGQYKRGDKGSSVCNVRVTMIHEKKADEKLGKLDDKYPIVYKRDTQMDVLVGDVLVNVYSSDAAFKKDGLGKLLTGLVDLEKLMAIQGK